ncbi:matrixin family metalloprotease [Flavihumibacter profundi]|uniref:matrixin family metalloprotease n=1 Tax=Flavihumibacter profundi TaxID=2716883 RepID=UPI001CC7F787|nr:matrixin family metalloprotease [Flavihumibacter profundi]MBZ5856674.1 matrixin family metalloprotease [Flavihumibacter profundi]
MKPLSALVSMATACLMLAACTKTDVKPENSLVFPAGTLYTAMPKAAFSKHKAGLLKAEYLTCNKSKSEGKTIIYNDKKTFPDAEFVSLDPRRGSTRMLTFAIGDQLTHDFGISQNAVHAAIERAMNTWSKASCTRLQMQQVFTTENLGYVSSQLGFGGYANNIADIQHAGFLPGEFFNQLTPGGGDFILAVTFTFIYFDENGAPTDIDGNGINDVAFRETYYNDNFQWRISKNTDYDIESVALHETGHALGLSHFGKGILCKDGKIRFTPRAVMNAVYVDALRQPKEEDKSFECAIWKNWNN